MRNRFAYAWIEILGLLMVISMSFGVARGNLAVSSPLQSVRIGDGGAATTMTTLWVDPIAGNDANDGATRATALRTIDMAWRRIPQAELLDQTGYHIRLVAGTYDADNVPHYMEERWGTEAFPIIIEAADGPGSVVLAAHLNVFDTRYLQILDLVIRPVPAGDTFHCERCEHVLLRGNTFDGGEYIRDGVGDVASDNIKVNQSRSIFLEDNDVHGASDNAVDFVAVQNGHLRNNRIHNAQDWCAYAKGGSANVLVEGNEIYDCGTGGFTAGQGTGFQFMTPPWTHYEAYGIKVVNNVIHHTEGASIGVNGGYNILVAHNTLYQTGSRAHTLEITFGGRSCDGNPGDDGRERCEQYLAAGGWGTIRVDDGTNYVRIPNKHVYVYNNIIYTPADAPSAHQLFFIPGPFDDAAQDGSNVPSPARADEDVQIRGNLIWSGGASTYLGIEDSDQGCQPSNPTCNRDQLLADNSINTTEPQLVDPARNDWRPVEAGNVFQVHTFSIPVFPNDDAPDDEPPTVLGPDVPTDRAGRRRTEPSVPGAYAASDAIPTSYNAYMPLVFH